MFISSCIVLLEHNLFTTYRSRSVLYVQAANNNEIQALSAKMTGLSTDLDSKDAVDRYLVRIHSSDFLSLAADKITKMPEFQGEDWAALAMKSSSTSMLNHALFHRSQTPPGVQGVQEVANLISSMVSVSKISNDSIEVLVTSGDRNFSVKLANAFSNFALTTMIEYDMEDLNEGERYLQVEIQKSEELIKETDAEIVSSRQHAHRRGDQSDSATNPSADLEKELTEAQVSFDENEKLIAELKKEKKIQERDAYAADGNTDQSDPKTYKFGISNKLSELEKSNQYLEVRKSTLHKILNSIKKSDNQKSDQELFDLDKKLELEYSMFQDLKRQLFQVEMLKISSRNKVRILEQARDSDVRNGQDLYIKILIGLALGLLGGLPAAYAWSLLVPNVRSRQDLEKLGLAYLGSFPDLKIRNGFSFSKKTRDRRNGPKAQPIVQFELDSSASMSFIHMRTKIQHHFPPSQENGHVIAVLSPNPGEGKSFISRNIAACIAHSSRRTLLIDCDLRSVGNSTFFGAESRPGIAEVLTNQKKFGAVMIPGVLPDVDLLPAGNRPYDVTALFSDETFNDFITAIRKTYDYIILDTPALSATPDAGLIADSASMNIIVAKCGVTTTVDIERSISNLIDENHTYFAVLNFVESVTEMLYILPRAMNDRRSQERRKWDRRASEEEARHL